MRRQSGWLVTQMARAIGSSNTMVFDGLDLGGLQELLFPIVEALGGPDIDGFIMEKGVILSEAADVLESTAAVLRLAGEATSDGIIDNDEINAVVAAAPTVEQAVKDLFDLIQGTEELA